MTNTNGREKQKTRRDGEIVAVAQRRVLETEEKRGGREKESDLNLFPCAKVHRADFIRPLVILTTASETAGE